MTKGNCTAVEIILIIDYEKPPKIGIKTIKKCKEKYLHFENKSCKNLTFL